MRIQQWQRKGVHPNTRGQYDTNSKVFYDWYNSRKDLLSFDYCTQAQAEDIFQRFALFMADAEKSGSHTSRILSAVNSDLTNKCKCFDRSKMKGLKHMLDAMDKEFLNSYQRRPFQDAMLDYGICKFLTGLDRDTRVIRCAFLLAKRKLLRKSNIIFDKLGEKTPYLCHLRFVPNYKQCHTIVFEVPKSKSRKKSEDEPRTIHCCCNWKPMRPCLLHELLDIVWSDWYTKRVGAPLFRMANGMPLANYRFNLEFARLVANLGLSLDFFKSHSFKMGGASDLKKAGKSDEDIRKAGGWKSKRSVRDYVMDDNPDLPQFENKWLTSNFDEVAVRPFLSKTKRLAPLSCVWKQLATRPTFTPKWVKDTKAVQPVASPQTMNAATLEFALNLF